MRELEPFDHDGHRGVVLRAEGFPSVWVSDNGQVEIDEWWIRTRDKAAVLAWLRSAADAVEAAS